MDLLVHSRYSVNTISFNYPCVCRVELANPNGLTVVCKRGYVEFTDTVRQRELRYPG